MLSAVCFMVTYKIEDLKLSLHWSVLDGNCAELTNLSFSLVSSINSAMHVIGNFWNAFQDLETLIKCYDSRA